MGKINLRHGMKIGLVRKNCDHLFPAHVEERMVGQYPDKRTQLVVCIDLSELPVVPYTLKELKDLGYKIKRLSKLTIALQVLRNYANIDFWKYKDVKDNKNPLHTSFEVQPLRDGWELAENALHYLTGKVRLPETQEEKKEL